MIVSPSAVNALVSKSGLAMRELNVSVYTLIALAIASAVLLTVMVSFSRRKKVRPDYVRARQVARRAALARGDHRETSQQDLR